MLFFITSNASFFRHCLTVILPRQFSVLVGLGIFYFHLSKRSSILTCNSEQCIVFIGISLSIGSVYNVDIQCVDTMLLCVFCLSHLVCVLCSWPSFRSMKCFSSSVLLCQVVGCTFADTACVLLSSLTQYFHCLPDPTVSSLSLLHFKLLDIFLALTSLFCRVNTYPHSYLIVGLYLFFIFPSETTFLFPKALP